MGQVPPEVGKVLLHQLLIALDDEEILRVLLLRRLREIEQARDQRLYACSSQTARGSSGRDALLLEPAAGMWKYRRARTS